MVKCQNAIRRNTAAAAFAAVIAIVVTGVDCIPVTAAAQTAEQAPGSAKATPTPPTVSPHPSAPITNVVDLFADFDPRKEPLDIELIKEWDEDGVHYEQMYITGQVFDGVSNRSYPGEK